MAAWGYEFYLLVLKVSLARSLRSLVRDTFSTRRYNSFPRHVISSIYNLYFKRVTPITMKSILPSGPVKTKSIIINYNSHDKKPIYK